MPPATYQSSVTCSS